MSIRRTILATPKHHVILPEIISKEPLSPLVVDDDSQWLDVVKWVVFALIQAEELGINSQNFSSFNKVRDSEIQRFLGNYGNLGRDLGLSNDFALKAIKHVGNYGEIYERHIGSQRQATKDAGKINSGYL